MRELKSLAVRCFYTVFYCELMMPRTADIHAAFIAAIELNPKGYRYLRTVSFIQQLIGFNLNFIRNDANLWIECNQPDFADKATDAGGRA
ncbi:hypothetical protein LNGFDJGK_01669 [Enterobacter hormaechei]|nr:hypothetical protein LNGFDJGK_01669 [Enterobacter hormaechei]VAC60754.1 Uncharacterised protein [Enterobacter hormaechei]VAC88234.1 Uncharacterised protein [Enterobacter hormaechei]